MDDATNDGYGRIVEIWAKWAIPKLTNQTRFNFDENNFGRNLLSMRITRENKSGEKRNWTTTTDHEILRSYDFIAYE